MKTEHPHAEFLAEVLKDISREIEGSCDNWLTFRRFGFTEIIFLANIWQFRFVDINPKCVSPITNDEMTDVINNCIENNEPDYYRAVANAAHRAAIKQVAELPAVTSLSDEELNMLWKNNFFRDSVNYAIYEFQRTLLKQIGEVK